MLVCGACAPATDADLFRVDAIEPIRIEAGESVVVAGQGFPTGREARVILDGVAYRPGIEPRQTRAAILARAASSERLMFEATDAWVQALGGRSSFHGRLRVEFRAPGSSLRVVGERAGVRVDLFPASETDLPAVLDRARVAAVFRRFAGIEFAHEHGVETGIVVASVVPDGAAARAGLLAGDRILDADGLVIDTATEVVPRPSLDTMDLRIERPGEATVLDARVDLRGFLGRTGLRLDGNKIAWLAAAVVVLLMLLSPLARLTSWGARAVLEPWDFGHQSVGFAQWFVGSEAWEHFKAEQRAKWRILTTAVCLASLGAVAAVCAGLGGDADAGLILLLAAVCRAAAASSPPDARGVRGWLRVLAGFALPLAPLCFAALAAALLSGAWGISGMVDAQGGWPWQWFALRSPIGLVLLPACTLAVVAATVPAHARAPGSKLAPQILERVQVLLMNGFLAATLLGGWSLPGVARTGSTPLFAAAIGVFALKAWLLTAGCLRLRAALRDPVAISRRLAWAALPASAAAAAAAAGCVLFGVQTTEYSPIVAATAATAGGHLLYRCVRRRAATPAPRVPMFL